MKYFYTTLLFALSIYTHAQTNGSASDFLGKISLSVMLDEQRESLTIPQRNKIESKIIALASRYGISGRGPSNFLITPRFEIYNEQMMEGMQNMYVVTVDLNLFIKQAKAGIIYSTLTKQLQGTGYSRNDAITNAISQININDPDVKKFMDEGKSKIISFYNSKCSDILLEAEKYAGTNNFDHALAILMCVPVEATPCYEKIKNKSIEIFKKSQTKNCQSIIQLAKTQEAANQYLTSLQTLSQLDPTASCFKESQTIIKSVEAKLDADIKRQWDMEREKMKNKLELEKLQLQTISQSVSSVFGGGSGGSSSPQGGNSIWGTILNFLF